MRRCGVSESVSMVEYRQMVRQRDVMRDAVTTALNALWFAAEALSQEGTSEAAFDAQRAYDDLRSALFALQTEVRTDD